MKKVILLISVSLIFALSPSDIPNYDKYYKPQEFRNDSIFEIIFQTKKRKYDNNNYLHIIIIIIALSILIGFFYICCFLKKKADYYHYLLNYFSQISINDNKNVDNNINSTEYSSKKDNFIL